MDGCGCQGGCDTNRCSCYSSSRQSTHTFRCTNCLNSGSIGKNSSSKQNATTVVATTGGGGGGGGGGTNVQSDDTDDNITEDTEKVEEIAPLNTNTEIKDWEDYNYDKHNIVNCFKNKSLPHLPQLILKQPLNSTSTSPPPPPFLLI